MELVTKKGERVLGALYKLGDSPIRKIASETLINRTALYYTMDELLKKGLVTKIKKDSGSYFQAISPTEYKTWAKRQVDSLSEQAERLEETLQRVRNESPTLHSDVRYFEGAEGVKNLYADTWRDNEEKIIYAITDYDKAYKVLGDFFENEYFSDRVRHGVKVKSLLSKSKSGLRDISRSEKLLRDMRFLDVFKNLGIEINVYGDKLSIVTFDDKEPSGIMIKNEIIAKAFKSLFTYIWDTAKK